MSEVIPQQETDQKTETEVKVEVKSADAVNSERTQDRKEAGEPGLEDSFTYLGFTERPEWFDEKGMTKATEEHKAYTTKRAKKWDTKYSENKKVPHQSRKMKRWMRKGVPMAYRNVAWRHLSGASALVAEHKGEYKSLVDQYSTEDNKTTIQIDKDLHRTYPKNKYFKVSETYIEYRQLHPNEPTREEHIPVLVATMRRILRALACKESRIGYCQGLNYITGLILLVLEDEEETFWAVWNLTTRLTPMYHLADFSSLRTETTVLSNLLEVHNKDIFDHMAANNVMLELVTTQWFICLFIDVLPLPVVLRVWDALFYEGYKVLIRVALALFVINKERIMELEDGECFQFCKNMGQTVSDATELLRIAFGFSWMRRKQIVAIREKTEEGEKS